MKQLKKVYATHKHTSHNRVKSFWACVIFFMMIYIFYLCISTYTNAQATEKIIRPTNLCNSFSSFSSPYSLPSPLFLFLSTQIELEVFCFTQTLVWQFASDNFITLTNCKPKKISTLNNYYLFYKQIFPSRKVSCT